MPRNFKTMDVGESHPNSRSRWMRGIPKKTTVQIAAMTGMAEGDVVYDTTLNGLYHYNGSSWAAVATPTTLDLDAVYDNGSSATVDASAVTLAGNKSGINILAVTNAASTSPLVQLTHTTTTSKDINGTGSTWYVTGQGAATFTSIATGSSATAIVINTDKFTVNGSNGNTLVAGTLSATGNFKVNTTMFTVDATNGNTVVAGDLTVSGSFSIGTLAVSTAFSLGADSTHGIDGYFYTNDAGDYVIWDTSEKTLKFIDSKAHFEDNDAIEFGTGAAIGTGDFDLYSNGTNLFILANANVTGQTLYIGDHTNELDLYWRSTTTGDYVLFDSDALNVVFEDVSATFMDSTPLNFGDSKDFVFTYIDPDITLTAVADVADQAFKIGSDSEDIDVFIYGDTAGDYLQFDSSGNQLKLVDVDISSTESATGTTSLTISSANTSVHAVSITSTGVLASDIGALYLRATGNVDNGSSIFRISQDTGTPVAGSIAAEIVGAGDIIGIVCTTATVTNDANTFTCSGNIAANKSALKIGISGTPAAATARGLTIAHTKDCYGLYIDVDNTTGDSNYINCGGDLGAGKSVLYISYDNATNTNKDTSLLHLVTAKDMYGLYVETATATNHVAYFATSGAIGSGKAVIFATASGSPNAASSLVRADAAKDCYGIYSDVDATTNHCNLFTTGAVTAANKGIVAIVPNAGDPAAGANCLYIDYTAATFTNNNSAVFIKSKGTGAQLSIQSVDTGAVGCYIKTDFVPTGSSAANDVPFQLICNGIDDGNNAHEWGKIVLTATTVAHGTEASDWRFYVQDGAGTDTLYMTLAKNLLTIGNGAASYISSAGTQNLILETNGGTNSGTITITQGANAAITLSPNGTGSTVANGFAAKFHGTAVTSANDGAIAVTECIRYYDTSGAAACADTLPDISTNYGYFIMLYMKTDGAADAVVTAAGADKIVESSADAANTTVTLNDAGDFCLLFASAPAVWAVIVNSGCTIA